MRLPASRVAASIRTPPMTYTLIPFGGKPRSCQTPSASSFTRASLSEANRPAPERPCLTIRVRSVERRGVHRDEAEPEGVESEAALARSHAGEADLVAVDHQRRLELEHAHAVEDSRDGGQLDLRLLLAGPAFDPDPHAAPGRPEPQHAPEPLEEAHAHRAILRLQREDAGRARRTMAACNW